MNRATAIEQPRTAYTTGECPHIDHRKSLADASMMVDPVVCLGCGCLLDPPAHAPRCERKAA